MSVSGCVPKWLRVKNDGFAWGVSKKERGKLGVKTCGPNFQFWRVCDTPRTKRVFLSVDMLLLLRLENAPGTRINRS